MDKLEWALTWSVEERLAYQPVKGDSILQDDHAATFLEFSGHGDLEIDLNRILNFGGGEFTFPFAFEVYCTLNYRVRIEVYCALPPSRQDVMAIVAKNDGSYDVDEPYMLKVQGTAAFSLGSAVESAHLTEADVERLLDGLLTNPENIRVDNMKATPIELDWS